MTITWLICVIVEQCMSQCLSVDGNVDIPSNVNIRKLWKQALNAYF